MIDLFIHHAPTIGTLFFFLTFCYVIFSVFKKGNKKKFDKYSQIPLDDLDDESKVKSKK